MKTTLNIDDAVMQRLRLESARSGHTMSELVEAGLRLVLEPRHGSTTAELPPLPVFDLGGAAVDVADRDAHTAVLMREHGIERIVTCDTDFHRFPFVSAVDPLAA